MASSKLTDTQNKVREYLRQVAHTDQLLRLHAACVVELEQTVEALLSASELLACFGAEPSVESLKAHHICLERIRKNLDAMDQQINKRQVLLDRLDQLDHVSREIIVSHYLKGHTWQKVAREINYSSSHVYELRRSALDELADLI